MSASLKGDLAEIRRALKFLVEPGAVVELRALRQDETPISGYFDDVEALAKIVAGAKPHVAGVYVTINPVLPSLLARAHNRVRDKLGKKGRTTDDSEIQKRARLLVDVDHDRPSGISATDEEHAAAISAALKIRDYLRSLGWPDPLVGDSGNGGHLVYAVDLPADDGGLVAKVVAALAAKFDSGPVKVDRKVFNPSRISKVYGTVARKGDHTDQRPHRLSRILEAPASLAVVPREKLEALVAAAAASPHAPNAAPGPSPRPASPPAADDWDSAAEASRPRRRDGDLARAWPMLGAPQLLELLGGEPWRLVAGRVEGPCPAKRGRCAEDPRAAFVHPRTDGGPPGAFCAHRGTCGSWTSVYDLVAQRLGNDRRAATAAVLRAAGIEPASAAPTQTSAAGEDPIRLTDLGNARRLLRRHGRDLRYSSFLGWLVWDGNRWRQDHDGAVERLALDVPRELFDEAAEVEARAAAAQGEERERLEDLAASIAKWAATSEGERAQRRLIRLAQVLPGVPVHPDELDRNPWLLCCPNGTVDLRTGELLAADRDHMLTRSSGARYDPGASSPIWLAFLNKITGNKPESVEFLHRIAGYALTGDTREQCFFLFHGKGANGKSTFIDVLRAVAGDYARVAQFSSFTAKQNEGIRSDLARLRGARLVSAIETKEGARLDEGLVKQITGGDPVTACFKYKDEFEFTPILKLILAANEKPEIRGSDLGIWRRVRLVPFEVTIPEAERDETLKEKILAELPGVLAWAVAGARAWLMDGLAETTEARAARDAYKDDQDELGPFLESECLVAQNAQVDSSSLYKAYAAWADSEGVYKVSTKVFAGRLEAAGFKKTRRGQAHATRGRTSWLGLSLLPKGEDDVPESAYDDYQRGR